MIKLTEELIRCAVQGDATITKEQLQAGLDCFAGKSIRTILNPEPLVRVLSRTEVAELISKSPKQVDALCRRGALTRVYSHYADGTRAKRACGISESSYRAFVGSGKEA